MLRTLAAACNVGCRMRVCFVASDAAAIATYCKADANATHGLMQAVHVGGAGHIKAHSVLRQHNNAALGGRVLGFRRRGGCMDGNDAGTAHASIAETTPPVWDTMQEATTAQTSDFFVREGLPAQHSAPHTRHSAGSSGTLLQRVHAVDE